MRDMRAITAAATGAVALAVSLTACTDSSGSSASGSASEDAGSAKILTVFAAASLTDVYAQINDEFEAAHPGVTVSMTNGGSNELVTQIGQGAPADILATADQKNMDAAQKQGLVSGTPTVFATNELTIAVQPGNPQHITALADLERPGLQVVECATEVPCGSVAEKVLGAAGVQLTPVSEEGSVTDVLGKVTTGNADAGLVYATDIRRSGGKAEAVAIPQAADFRTSYPIAEVAGARNADLARAYVAFVMQPGPQETLRNAGFGKP